MASKEAFAPYLFRFETVKIRLGARPHIFCLSIPFKTSIWPQLQNDAECKNQTICELRTLGDDLSLPFWLVG